MFCTKPHIIFFVWSHSIKIPPIRNRITKITGDHLNTKAPPWSEPCSNTLPLCITLIWFDLLKSFPTPPQKKRGVCNIYVLPCFSWLSSIPKHSMYGIVTKCSCYFYGACRKTYHIFRFRETSHIHRSSFLAVLLWTMLHRSNFNSTCGPSACCVPPDQAGISSRKIRGNWEVPKKKNIAGWCCG